MRPAVDGHGLDVASGVEAESPQCAAQKGHHLLLEVGEVPAHQLAPPRCGLLTGRPTQEALNLGWAHGALLTTFHGDVTMAKLAEVEAFAKGGSARVQR